MLSYFNNLKIELGIPRGSYYFASIFFLYITLESNLGYRSRDRQYFGFNLDNYWYYSDGLPNELYLISVTIILAFFLLILLTLFESVVYLSSYVRRRLASIVDLGTLFTINEGIYATVFLVEVSMLVFASFIFLMYGLVISSGFFGIIISAVLLLLGLRTPPQVLDLSSSHSDSPKSIGK